MLEGDPLRDLSPQQLALAKEHSKNIEICEPVEVEKLKKLQAEGINVNKIIEFRDKFKEYKEREGDYLRLK